MLARNSVRRPYTVIVGIILVAVLGYISFQHTTTDLLPSMNLPYVVVYTPYLGATPEQVEADLTRPMESSFATLTDVKAITSSSQDNVAVVVMQFNDGANMDTALIEISSRLDQLRGGWDDAIGAPVTMKLNPDMLPVAILSVTQDDMDILELSDYVEDELIPSFESLNGVASASASGLIRQRIDVTIEQGRIDVLNSAILRDVDAQLADVEAELIAAQAQLSDGKRQLARAKAAAFARIDDALAAIDAGAARIDPAIADLAAQRDALAAQRESLAAAIQQMDGLVDLDDDAKAQLRLLTRQLAALKQQREALAAQLEGSAEADPEALAAQLADARAQREELALARDGLNAYVEDLSTLDAEALRAAVAALEATVAADTQALLEARAQRAVLEAGRDAAQRRVEDLEARLAALGTPAPSEGPAESDPPAPSESPAESNPPAESDAPTETEAPAKSEAPANSDGADESDAQETTDAPPEVNAAGTEAAPRPEPEREATPEPLPTPEAPEAGEAELSALGRLGAALAEAPDREALEAELAEARTALAEAQAALDAKTGEIDALSARLAEAGADLAAKRLALATLEADAAGAQSRIEEARRQAETLDARIAALDQEIAALEAQSSGDAEALGEQIDALDRQIAALEQSDAMRAAMLLENPETLEAQYAQAQAGLAEMDAGLAQMDAALEKLRKGIIPGGFIEGIDEDTKLSDARAQLTDARRQAVEGFAEAEAQLADGEAELAKARSEFNEKRDEALESAGLDGVVTVQTVSGLIGAQNFAMPAGYVYDAESEQVLVRVGDKFASLDALRRMKLFDLGLDSVDEVRLMDVASVALADDREDVFTKLDGADGILLAFDKQSTYSTADVAETILARAAALDAADPNLHLVDLMNQGEYIDVIVDSVLSNLLTGGALAILVLLLFLLDWRPTITVAFSIPISVVISFVCMYFSGITLNVLSLSGLGLGIGMLVDNSIVAVESVYRLHEEEGVPLLRACVEGVKSVSGALFASTLTTICVFLPIVFVQGMARDLFADMGLTIAFSLLASLLVAMTVVPMFTSFLMRRSKPRRHRVFGAMQRFYLWLLRGALRAKPLALLAALALLVWTGMQVPKMGISFMPEVNSRQMSADLTFDAELTTRQRRDQAMAIMEDMMAIEGVDTVGLMDGSGGMLSGLSGGGGMSYYILVDEAAGRRNADIAADMNALGARHGANLVAQASTMDISMLTGSGISVEITGDDLETLQAIARDVADIARQTEGVTDVDDGLEEAVPELRIEVDKEKAIENGLTTAQVYQFVAQKLAGEIEISQVTLDGKTLSIYLVDGANSDLRPEELQDLEIEVAGEGENKLVRVGDIAALRDTASLSTIRRAAQRRVVTVSFGIADGYSANLVSDAFEARLAEYDVPAGCAVDLAGENETVMDIMDDLVWMVLIAVLLIFLIMVAQFQSFKSPIIVMFTIPLAFTGGLLALLLTGMDLSIVSMLGFLVLSGVVVNNGIVFIDCVNQLRIAGMEKRPALLEAGRQRLRPILMTAMTTILGMSTMALGHGTGAEMMQPMAVVSIGGLTYATLMTLFIVPVLYDLFNGRTMKAREIQMIREAAGLNGDALPGEAAPEAAASTPGAASGTGAAAEAATPAAPETAASTPGAASGLGAAAEAMAPVAPPAPRFDPIQPTPVAQPVRVRLTPRKRR